MPTLSVLFNKGIRDIPFSRGLSVREILEGAGIRIRSGCRGNGACGLCLVQIESGATGPLDGNEQILLSQEQINGNIRLACGLFPKSDITIRIVGAAVESDWRMLTPGDIPCLPPRSNLSFPDQPFPGALGLSVDVGTTHISISLWELARGVRIAGRIGSNPQADYGADVVTRLMAAAESPDNARQMTSSVIEAIAVGLREMCIDNGQMPQQVSRVRIVANTAMLTLLTESDPQTLLQPNSWALPISNTFNNAASWIRTLEIYQNAVVEIEQPLAGFVGSDLLAGILATGLTRFPGALLIDFGTNSEIALWDGAKLWVTSAAGGPAFETSRVECGMPGEIGAVSHVNLENGLLRFDVIGGGTAQGICGSGLVDLIACLRRLGGLLPTGRFSAPDSQGGIALGIEGGPLRLSHSAVDMFQRAKAGIGAGIETLLSMARVRTEDLNRICLCGIFGSNLNILNAEEIGLLPAVAPGRVELCGNTALAGCERLVMLPKEASAMAYLRSHSTIVNLASVEDFEARFLENLYLKPMKNGTL